MSALQPGAADLLRAPAPSPPGGSHVAVRVWQRLPSCNDTVVMVSTHAHDVRTLPVHVSRVSSSPLSTSAAVSEEGAALTPRYASAVFIQMRDAPELNRGSSELAA